LSDIKTGHVSQRQRHVSAVQEKRRQISPIQTDDTVRNGRVEKGIDSNRDSVFAANRAGEFFSSVEDVFQVGFHDSDFRLHVRAEHEHVLRRNPFHRLVFRPLPEVRGHQQGFDGAENRHGRAEQIPVHVEVQGKTRENREHRGRLQQRYPADAGRRPLDGQLRRGNKNQTQAGPRGGEQPERFVRRPAGTVHVLAVYVLHVRLVLSYSGNNESVQVHHTDIRLDLTVQRSVRIHYGPGAPDVETGELKIVLSGKVYASDRETSWVSLDCSRRDIIVLDIIFYIYPIL